MPKEGFKTITVSEEVYNKLEELAQERFTTVPRIVEYLVSKLKVEKSGVAPHVLTVENEKLSKEKESAVQ